MKTQKLKEKYKLADLKKAAKEINEVCGFEDFPKVDKKEWEQLVDILDEAGPEIYTKDNPDEEGQYDDLSDETLELMGDFGFISTQAAEEEEPEEVEPEEDDKPDEEEGEPSAQEILDEIKEAGTLKELKDIAKAYDQFKGIRGGLNSFKAVKALKNELKSRIEDPEPKKKEKAKKEPEKKVEKEPKKVEKKKEKPVSEEKEVKQKPAKEKKKSNTASYSRIDSVCEALKTSKENEVDSTEKLIKKADDIYVEKTGRSSNYKESRAMTNFAVKALSHFDIKVPSK